MTKKTVLFVCVHNSARSQMAEAYLNKIGGDLFEAESAGLEAGTLNPLVIKAMAEAGIDISGKSTRRVFDVLKSGKRFHYVITVCDAANAQRCPVFPGALQYLNWSFPDPLQLKGTDEEIMNEVRKIRDAIKTKIQSWISEVKDESKTGPEIPQFEI